MTAVSGRGRRTVRPVLRSPRQKYTNSEGRSWVVYPPRSKPFFSTLPQRRMRHYLLLSKVDIRSIYSGVGWALFVSIALAASRVRSMCGSELSPPECDKQSFPASTPHVGHGTASSSCGVRSVILTDQAYGDASRRTVQIGT